MRGALYDRGGSDPRIRGSCTEHRQSHRRWHGQDAAWPHGLQPRCGARRASPAIVMRGYGDDEPLVHARLNPDVPVIATATACVGVATQAASAGADCVDSRRRVPASAHRARASDWVLVSAPSVGRTTRASCRRAAARAGQRRSRARPLVIVTRKSASRDARMRSRRRGIGHAMSRTSALAIVSVSRSAALVRRATRRANSRSRLRGATRARGRRAVGRSGGFFAQLRALGRES